jgi:DNA gyrase/topoisomerase IV subunit B
MVTNVRSGPTMTDTIYAQKLARFLEENPELAKWLCEKFKTHQGRKELEALTSIELRQ